MGVRPVYVDVLLTSYSVAGDHMGYSVIGQNFYLVPFGDVLPYDLLLGTSRFPECTGVKGRVLSIRISKKNVCLTASSTTHVPTSVVV